MNYFYCKKIIKPEGKTEYFPIGKLEVKDDKFIITGLSLLTSWKEFISHNMREEYTIPKNKKEIIELFKYLTWHEYTELVDENKVESDNRDKKFNSEKNVFDLKTFDFEISDNK
jgi:DNA polymerase III sliding clamp (beta) subunit (PCNA family)